MKEIDRQSQKYADRLFAPKPMPRDMPPSLQERLAKKVGEMEPGASAPRKAPSWSKGVAEPPRAAQNDLPRPWPVQVRQGENLRTLARWAGVTRTRLIKENKEALGRRKWLRAGDRLFLTMSSNQKVSFDRMRNSHAKARLDNYFASRYIAKVVVYRVNRHESVSDAARRYGDVPLWLLQQFNNRDFRRLRRGAEVLIPVVKRYHKADGLPPALQIVDATGDVLSADKQTSVSARLNSDMLGRARLAIDDGNVFERGDGTTYAASRSVLPSYAKPPTKPSAARAGLPSVASPAQPEPAAASTLREVLVMTGETLGKYAKWSGLSIRNIKAANPGLNPDLIYIGTRIRLPLSDDAWGHFVLARAGRSAAARVPQPSVPTAAAGGVGSTVPTAEPLMKPLPMRAVDEAAVEVFYSVRPGDIASKIARRGKTTLALLQAMNPSKNLHQLRIGQRLRIQ